MELLSGHKRDGRNHKENYQYIQLLKSEEVSYIQNIVNTIKCQTGTVFSHNSHRHRQIRIFLILSKFILKKRSLSSK